MSKDWTDDELRTLVEMKGQGATNQAIANTLGRTLMQVKACLARCLRASDEMEIAK